MYPYVVFLDMSLYEIFILIGIIYALVVFRVLADRKKIKSGLQNLVVLGGVSAIVFGYGSAVVFQAFYNYLDGKKFEISSNTGATFYGGLIGGAAFFLIIYFIAGHFLFTDKYHLQNAFSIVDICAVSVSGAHAFGRLGCLTAGCCYGAKTDSWLGVWNEGLGYNTIPVQLFEAIFLFALSGFLAWRILKNKRFGLSIYCCSYGVWRFFIEYLRADERGATFFDLITPSQLTAVVLFAVGVLLCFAVKRIQPKGDI